MYLWPSSLYVFFHLTKLLKCSFGKSKPTLHSMERLTNSAWDSLQEVIDRKLPSKDSKILNPRPVKMVASFHQLSPCTVTHRIFVVAPVLSGDDVCAVLSTKKLIWCVVSQILTVVGLSTHLHVGHTKLPQFHMKSSWSVQNTFHR